MKELVGLPEWLGTAAIGAVIAALGYLAKTAIELVTAARREQRERGAALVRLGSLLRATGVAFKMTSAIYLYIWPTNNGTAWAFPRRSTTPSLSC